MHVRKGTCLSVLSLKDAFTFTHTHTHTHTIRVGTHGCPALGLRAQRRGGGCCLGCGPTGRYRTLRDSLPPPLPPCLVGLAFSRALDTRFPRYPDPKLRLRGEPFPRWFWRFGGLAALSRVLASDAAARRVAGESLIAADSPGRAAASSEVARSGGGGGSSRMAGEASGRAGISAHCGPAHASPSSLAAGGQARLAAPVPLCEGPLSAAVGGCPWHPAAPCRVRLCRPRGPLCGPLVADRDAGAAGPPRCD